MLSWMPAEDLAALGILVQVVLIDLTLAGDNAIIVGMAAARLPPQDRRRAILIGIGIATALRVLFAVIAVRLLMVIGLTLAGGLLLLWVAWKMFREVCAKGKPGEGHEDALSAATAAKLSYRQALMRIVIADISMSLDNILAVAGTARNHLPVLAVGLVLSVGLMGLASTAVAKLLHHMPWLVWVGLAIVTYVALSMIWQGSWEVKRSMMG
jgi:YjbE family integral membrane protein